MFAQSVFLMWVLVAGVAMVCDGRCREVFHLEAAKAVVGGLLVGVAELLTRHRLSRHHLTAWQVWVMLTHAGKIGLLTGFLLSLMLTSVYLLAGR